MATFRKLPSGNVQAIVRVTGKPQQAATFQSLEAAKEWADVQEGKSLAKYCITNLTNAYMDDVMKIGGVERGGYETTKLRLVTLSLKLKMSVENITRADVLNYRDARLNDITRNGNKTVSGGTIRKEMELLTRFVKWACEEYNLTSSLVLKGNDYPKAGEARDKVITDKEYNSLLKWSKSKCEWMHPLMILGWETAMRLGEILSITPAMIDFAERHIKLTGDQTKNGEGRKVPLSTTAMKLLKELVKGKGRTEKLFSASKSSIPKAFKRACEYCEIEDAVFHSFRHTAITRYAKLGFSVLQLQAVSGHKDLDMLKNYTHIQAKDVASLMG